MRSPVPPPLDWPISANCTRWTSSSLADGQTQCQRRRQPASRARRRLSCFIVRGHALVSLPPTWQKALASPSSQDGLSPAKKTEQSQNRGRPQIHLTSPHPTTPVSPSSGTSSAPSLSSSHRASSSACRRVATTPAVPAPKTAELVLVADAPVPTLRMLAVSGGEPRGWPGGCAVADVVVVVD